MKTILTVEESQRLIDLGVDPKMASTTCINFNGTYAYVSGEESETVRDCVNGQYYTEECMCFSIADILSILPKEIDDSVLGMEYDSEFKQWWAGYNAVSLKSAPELIDALNKLAIWCLENGHLKTEKK